MGQVYRARDTKLDRDVAIKILPESFAFDVDRLARFQREAKTLASLNHPKIAAIFGLEESGGVSALVMELVEGENLSQRIARGAIPVEEALPIAKQIAEALEAAHEQGVIHRDLKPANIMVRADGMVKVLDFGLAKADSPTSSNINASMSPTLSLHATMTGVLLGTAAYMSPEQAGGKLVDKRTDVWSFGVVMWEMLTGRRLFEGETISHTLADVLRAGIDFDTLPSDLPQAMRDLLRRCLDRNANNRLRDIGEARFQLDKTLSGTVEHTTAPDVSPALSAAPPRLWWRRAMSIAIPAIFVGAIAGAASWYAKPSPALAVTRFLVTLGEGEEFVGSSRTPTAISPDGAQMAYIAIQRLYFPVDVGSRITGDTRNRNWPTVASPVFSADSRSLVFWSQADRTLKRIGVSGGAALTICPADNPSGMSWGKTASCLASLAKASCASRRMAVSPKFLSTVKDDELAHGPQILPGGQAVLFTLAKGVGPDRWDRARVVVQSLKSGERKTLIEGEAMRAICPLVTSCMRWAGALRCSVRPPAPGITGGPVPILKASAEQTTQRPALRSSVFPTPER